MKNATGLPPVAPTDVWSSKATTLEARDEDVFLPCDSLAIFHTWRIRG